MRYFLVFYTYSSSNTNHAGSGTQPIVNKSGFLNCVQTVTTLKQYVQKQLSAQENRHPESFYILIGITSILEVSAQDIDDWVKGLPE